MDTFVRNSFKQYQGQDNLRKTFVEQNDRIYEVFRDSNAIKTFISMEKGSKEENFFLFLIEPVVEVAWADGRVKSREMDALIQIADSYGLVDCQETYCKLMNSLISRPIPKYSALLWKRFYKLLDTLSVEEFETLSQGLLIQSQFVAERSSNYLIDFLRGDSICRDEMMVLEKIREVLKRVEIKKQEEEFELTRNEKEKEIRASRLTQKDIDKLLPLVPLIKVAWAEGRVTNREKQMIFEAARRWGITPETASHQKLSEWLEFHPTDDFYNESLKNLKSELQKLKPKDRFLRQLDLLSDCTLIAEASGGNSDFAAGGPRVCEEEIFAVKQIARKLKFSQTIALP
jgi:uncharacterized membrane protein YebE (DUF533 family)